MTSQPTPASTGAAPRWLDAEEMAAWRAFMETSKDLLMALDADLQGDSDLTLGDYEVLVFLSESPERRMRMCDLATRLQLSPSGLTRRLDGLVREGLVARQPCEADRRVLHAALTDSGMARLEAAAPAHVESVRKRLLDPLSHDQIVALGSIFQAVRSSLDCPGTTD